MGETVAPRPEAPMALDRTAANCCNGRVGRQLMEMAAQNDVIRQLVAPTGVALIEAAGRAGISVTEAANCCNGRVGQRLNVQELLAEMVGGGRGE